MKNLKKLLALSLALTMAISMVSCGKDDEKDNSKNKDDTAISSTANDEKEDTESESGAASEPTTLTIEDVLNYPESPAEDFELYDLKMDSDGSSKSYNIKSYKGNDEVVVIPSQIKNVDVIGINKVFYGNKNIKAIVIPDTVNSISRDAFKECENLEIVVFGNGIEKIGESSFVRCKSLKEINIPDSVTSIDSYAFYECENLEKVVLGDNVEYLREQCFSKCKSLYDINIPNSVKTIEERVFDECESLREITLTSNIEKLCNGYSSTLSSCFTGLENLIVNVPSDSPVLEYLQKRLTNSTGREQYTINIIDADDENNSETE